MMQIKISRTEFEDKLQDKDWRVAYAAVEATAKNVLKALPQGTTLTTTELVDAIYPKGDSFSDGVRKRVFKGLAALASHGMENWNSLGAPEKIGTVENARRKLWHNAREISTPVKVCQTCRRPL